MNQETARASYTSIAQSAYKAYSANTGNKNFRGDPMPDWDNLPEAIQTAWEAAARQIISITLQDPSSGTFPDEQRWNGWTRP